MKKRDEKADEKTKNVTFFILCVMCTNGMKINGTPATMLFILFHPAEQKIKKRPFLNFPISGMKRDEQIVAVLHKFGGGAIRGRAVVCGATQRLLIIFCCSAGDDNAPIEAVLH